MEHAEAMRGRRTVWIDRPLSDMRIRTKIKETTMSRSLLEGFALLYAIGALSVLAGLLRAAKAASEAAEAQHDHSVDAPHEGGRCSAEPRLSSKLLMVETAV
jgi:hypothetical protein